jgi:translocator protein
MQNKPFRAMRWLTLILQLISVFFNYLADFFNIGVNSVAGITAKYDSLFTPAGYTFAIWGVIYLALIAYCVVQLLPSQTNHLAYERLNKYVRFSAIAGIAWQIAFRYDKIAISVFIIFLMLIAAVIQFVRAHFTVNKRNFSSWFIVPFSLYLGWLCVAVVANVSILLVAINWNHAQMEPSTWVVIMLAIVLLITQSLSINFRDFVLPLVIVWASIGIWVALKNRDITTSHACMGAAVAALLIAIVAAYKRNKYKYLNAAKR